MTWEERATTDPDRIYAAWSRAPYGIGIACGPSGLLVVDLDVPKLGEDPPPEAWRIPGVSDGADAFAVVCERAGQPVPHDTWTVATPSGGTHLYYRHPAGPDLRNTTGTYGGGLGWLIDTRAHGGYVAAPPSVAEGGTYRLLNDTPPVALPPWLAAALTPAPRPVPGPVSVALSAATGGSEDARRGAYLRSAVDATLRQVADAPAGARNRALFGAAVSLGQLIAGGELDHDTTVALLRQAGEGVGQTPTEAAKTVASGIRTGQQRPRTLQPATTTTTKEAA